jgi:hypothetical protein
MTLEIKFSTISSSDVYDLIARHQEEHLQLEFKTINSPDMASSDDKRNLARALSGFANSSGGILIWGVIAVKDSDGIDTASSTAEIQSLSRFITRLNELTGNAALPIIDGVMHRPLPTSDDRGFAVSIVPASESGPHMAKLGENRYYKRSGDSFYQMEHFDIEDMFGRRKKPKLELYAHVRGSGPQTEITIGITNNGRGTARAPYLAFNAPAPFHLSIYGIDGNGHEGLPRLHARGSELPLLFGGNSNYVIHPETTLQVASLFLGIPPPGNLTLPETVAIDYEITAEDSRIVKARLDVSLAHTEQKQSSA